MDKYHVEKVGGIFDLNPSGFLAEANGVSRISPSTSRKKSALVPLSPLPVPSLTYITV